MSVYQKILNFLATPVARILPTELQDLIIIQVYPDEEIQLSDIVSMSDSQLDQQLVRSSVRLMPTWNKIDKILEVTKLFRANLPPEEKYISLNDNFRSYLQLSDQDIINLIEMRNKDQEYPLMISSNKLENIKTLILDSWFIPTKKKNRIGPLSSMNYYALISLYPTEFAEIYPIIKKYSPNNIMLIFSQMLRRQIPISPVKTFRQWSKLGVKINKGAKAIGILMPVQIDKGGPDDYVYFQYRKTLFAQSQTSAADQPPILDEEVSEWSSDKLVDQLIKENLIISIDDLQRSSSKIGGRSAADFMTAQIIDRAIYLKLDALNLEDDNEYRASFRLIRSVVKYILGLTDIPPSRSSGYLDYVHNLTSITKIIDFIIQGGY